MKTVFGLLAVVCSVVAPAQAVFGEADRAWMIGPAKAISSGVVMDYQFSPAGTWLLYSKSDINSAFRPDPTSPPVAKWNLYNCARGTSTELNTAGLSSNCNFILLGDERNAFFADKVNPQIQGFYNLQTGQIQKTAINFEGVFYFGDRAGCPFILFESSDNTVGLVQPGLAPQSYKLKTRVGLQSPYYADATHIKFAGYSRNTTPTQFLDITLNRQTGDMQMRELSREAWSKIMNEEEASEFDLTRDGAEYRLGLPPLQTGQKPKPTILERTAFLCHESFRPLLNSTKSQIAYLDNGALLLREVKPFDPALAEKLRKDALKAEALSKAKQVGMALMMYAADMDDVLPNAENFSKLMPYLKDRKMLDSFNYSFPGGSMTSIAEPANTELGFVLAPGGKAVVYADGHAKWIGDKP